MTKVIARVHPVHLMNVDWAPGGRQPSDQASQLGLWVCRKLAAIIYIHLAIVIITQPVGWYSFYRPTKSGRLSRPKHCIKGAQPVLKTVYCSSCHNKHNCQWSDSNLGPLTPQSDALTTWPLRPEVLEVKWSSQKWTSIESVVLCHVDRPIPFCADDDVVIRHTDRVITLWSMSCCSLASVTGGGVYRADGHRWLGWRRV